MSIAVVSPCMDHALESRKACSGIWKVVTGERSSSLAHEPVKALPVARFPRPWPRSHVPIRGSSSSSGASGSADKNAVVMQLLGESLTQLRLRQPSGRFRPSTGMELSVQMLHAIEACHRAGWVHRDIKPSNFCVGAPVVTHPCLPRLREMAGLERFTRASGAPRLRDLRLSRDMPSRGQVFLLDYGLARPYLTPEAKAEAALLRPASAAAALPDGAVSCHRSQRYTGQFRGTKSYASVSAHEQKDLGRRDDLWSLFYTVVDLVAPQGLPWRDTAREREWDAKRRQASAAFNEAARQEADGDERAAIEREAAADLKRSAEGSAAANAVPPAGGPAASEAAAPSSVATSGAPASAAAAEAAPSKPSPAPTRRSSSSSRAASPAATDGPMDREQVGQLKQQAQKNPGMLFPEDMPGRASLLAVSSHLSSLSHEAKPDYALVCRLMVAARDELLAAEEEEEKRLWAAWVDACCSPAEDLGTGSSPYTAAAISSHEGQGSSSSSSGSSPAGRGNGTSSAGAAKATAACSGTARGSLRSFPGGLGPDGTGQPPADQMPPAALRQARWAVATAIDCEPGLFDTRATPMSCDTVLESRGGSWVAAEGPGMRLGPVSRLGRSQAILSLSRDESGAEGAPSVPAPGEPWSEADVEAALYSALGLDCAGSLVQDQTQHELEEEAEAEAARGSAGSSSAAGRAGDASSAGRRAAKRPRSSSPPAASAAKKASAASPAAAASSPLVTSSGAPFRAGSVESQAAEAARRAKAVIEARASTSEQRRERMEACLSLARVIRARVWPQLTEGMDTMASAFTHMALAGLSACAAVTSSGTGTPLDKAAHRASALVEFGLLAEAGALEEWVAECGSRLPLTATGGLTALDGMDDLVATEVGSADPGAPSHGMSGNALGATGSGEGATEALLLLSLVVDSPIAGAEGGLAAAAKAAVAAALAAGIPAFQLVPGAAGGGVVARRARLAIWRHRVEAAAREERLRVAPTKQGLRKRLGPSLHGPPKPSLAPPQPLAKPAKAAEQSKPSPAPVVSVAQPVVTAAPYQYGAPGEATRDSLDDSTRARRSESLSTAAARSLPAARPAAPPESQPQGSLQPPPPPPPQPQTLGRSFSGFQQQPVTDAERRLLPAPPLPQHLHQPQPSRSHQGHPSASSGRWTSDRAEGWPPSSRAADSASLPPPPARAPSQGPADGRHSVGRHVSSSPPAHVHHHAPQPAQPQHAQRRSPPPGGLLGPPPSSRHTDAVGALVPLDRRSASRDRFPDSHAPGYARSSSRDRGGPHWQAHPGHATTARMDASGRSSAPSRPSMSHEGRAAATSAYGSRQPQQQEPPQAAEWQRRPAPAGPHAGASLRPPGPSPLAPEGGYRDRYAGHDAAPRPAYTDMPPTWDRAGAAPGRDLARRGSSADGPGRAPEWSDRGDSHGRHASQGPVAADGQRGDSFRSRPPGQQQPQQPQHRGHHHHNGLHQGQHDRRPAPAPAARGPPAAHHRAGGAPSWDPRDDPRGGMASQRRAPRGDDARRWDAPPPTAQRQQYGWRGGGADAGMDRRNFAGPRYDRQGVPVQPGREGGRSAPDAAWSHPAPRRPPPPRGQGNAW